MPITLNREEIIDKVCRLAAEQAGVDSATVKLDTDLFSDLNFDSLDAVEFTMTMEEQFEITIPDAKAEEVKTIRQAVDLLCAPFEKTAS